MTPDLRRDDPLATARRLKRRTFHAGGIRRRYLLTARRFRAARDLLVAAGRRHRRALTECRRAVVA